MAEVTVKLPNEFLRKLTKLGKQTDAVCEKMLEAGAEVVEAKIRDNLRAVIGRDTQGPSRSSGVSTRYSSGAVPVNTPVSTGIPMSSASAFSSASRRHPQREGRFRRATFGRREQRQNRQHH